MKRERSPYGGGQLAIWWGRALHRGGRSLPYGAVGLATRNVGPVTWRGRACNIEKKCLTLGEEGSQHVRMHACFQWGVGVGSNT